MSDGYLKYCLDADVFIRSYRDIYPRNVFPGLYKQLEQKIPRSSVVLLNILEQITTPARLIEWIKSTNIAIIDSKKNHVINEEFNRLNKKYQPNTGPKGVDTDDLRLIAYAKVKNLTVVTYESYQVQKPVKMSNYKIPLVCETENVRWLKPIEYFKELGISVGESTKDKDKKNEGE